MIKPAPKADNIRQPRRPIVVLTLEQTKHVSGGSSEPGANVKGNEPRCH